MAKLTLKQKIAIQQKEGKHQPARVDKNPGGSRSAEKLKRILSLLVAALAFFLYANTLGHGWVLDDDSLIKENAMTRKGVASLGEILSSTYRAGWVNMDYELYRPLSKAVFAIEWQLWPDNPLPAHLVNALLYALTGFLLFYSLSLYLRQNLIAAFLASCLFVAHPIHTEVVANVKSLDEILSVLFFLITTICIYRYLQNHSTRYAVAGLASFFLSLLSKESAVTFLLIVPLMIWFFTDAKRPENLKITIALAALTVVFLIIRMVVIQKALGNNVAGIEITPIDNVMAGLSVVKRFPTALFMMALYLKLFFLPHPLVSDYSFNQIPVIGFMNWRFLLALAVYAGLAAYALVQSRKKSPVAFGIIYFFITASVASNIVILIGTSFGERLMYAPSVGFCIAIAFVLTAITVRESQNGNSIENAGAFFKKHLLAIGLAAVLILPYSFKTIRRNADWRDNLTLFSADVKNSPNSAHAHFYLGNYLSQESVIKKLGDSNSQINNNLERAVKELSLATQIYPEYADAYQQLGNIYVLRKEFSKAEDYYHKALAIRPWSPLFLNNYGNALFNDGRVEEARKQFEEAIRWNPTYADAFYNLASAYGTLGDYARSAQQDASARQLYETAILNFKKTVEYDPDYSKAYRFMGLTYQNLGDSNNAQFYLNKAKELDSKRQ